MGQFHIIRYCPIYSIYELPKSRVSTNIIPGKIKLNILYPTDMRL